ncbi:ribosome biogenesis ATPase RIX7 [Echria macrotheca]|uniref:Ribosome biogenesis ATPase RIX7 n=1 Tax=Echria macrotheca TaxID=438768 RepID=A0AAJ0BNP8_9PEZI|nr:ribosome biogenesis ATPase RIX7 [Echria macrotheca]
MSRPSLRNTIERGVYGIVQKLEEDNEDGEKRRKMTVAEVYAAIKGSNSSLARLKKKPLEDAIERVLDVRRAEERENEEEDEDAVIEERVAREERERERERDAGELLNRQIAKGWGLMKKKSKAEEREPGPDADGDTVMGQAGTQAGTQAGSVEVRSSGNRQANGEARPKKRKMISTTTTTVDRTPSTGVSIRDVAGMDAALRRLLDEVWVPLCGGSACENINFRYDNCVLLHGPSGCGKTMLANAVAGSVGVSFIPIQATTLVSGTSGESEKNIRDVFEEAVRLAPCLLFIDEIDAIAGKRDSANKGMETRIVSEMMAGMDRIRADCPPGRNVVVLAATNRPESLDHSIRRRFSAEIDIGMPGEAAREQILRSMLRDTKVDADVDFRELAKLTPGFVGGDLRDVVKAAVVKSLRAGVDEILARAADLRDPGELDGLSEVQREWLLLEDFRKASWGQRPVAARHFRAAIASVQPASRREGFSTIPDTTWADVGAMNDVRLKLENAIIGPISKPEWFKKVGITAAAGILLWGPPGCGKTLVAKAVANESKANFISIKGPELLSKYVGDSERAVRQLFARAKSSAPCILFFDEMDALAPRRDSDAASGNAGARVVNALLTELDGVGDRTGIYVIGATNRPDIIDEAIRRPGRLGTSIYIGLPSRDERVEILRTLYRRKIAAATGKTGKETFGEEEEENGMDALLERVARDKRCDGFSGADLGNLMQAAGYACLNRTHDSWAGGTDAEGEEAKDPVITMEDWEVALGEVRPSVKDASMYDEIA